MIERRRANIEKTGSFVHVVAMSGRHASRPDLKAFSVFLPVDSVDTELGAAIRSALQASRSLFSDAELRSFFDPAIMEIERRTWANDAARRFGFANVKLMNAEMISLGVTESAGLVTFDPTVRDTGGWTRKGAAASRTVRLGCADDEIGRVAMEALADCR